MTCSLGKMKRRWEGWGASACSRETAGERARKLCMCSAETRHAWEKKSDNGSRSRLPLLNSSFVCFFFLHLL